MPFMTIGLGAGMALSSWLLLHGFVAPLSDGPKHLLGFIALAASTSFLLSASFRPHALRGGTALLLAAASFWAPHGVATALLVAAWAVLRLVPGLGALLVALELIAS